MAEMTMNKVIHGAVRRDLRRFLDATAAFRDGDRDRAEALGRAWDNFDEQLTQHHEGEHEIAWPALLQIGVGQEQLTGFDVEHEAMARALGDARAAMGRFRASASAADAASSHAAVATLQEVTELHLEHEEELTEGYVLEHADHPAMKEMGRRFGKVPPARAGHFFAWVLDGATPAERASVEGSVPKPILRILGGLFGRGYRRDVAPVWRA